MDFSTIKNELFPVIATIFSKTNSLAIKVRGLEAFATLCGGSNDPLSDDGLDGLSSDKKKGTSSTALDKFTMQEKIIPLIAAIKTREPAVMMAALNVLKVVGVVADADFVAMSILPLLWSMSLGPQLNLKEFQSFMTLIKSLSSRVEDEQTKKLQELQGGNVTTPGAKDDFMSFGAIAGSTLDTNGTSESDFEALVKGRIPTSAVANPMDSGWDTATPSMTSPLSNSSTARKSTPTATFSWSSPPASSAGSTALKPQQPSFRTVTPDLTSFQPMAPTTTQFSQPLQPQSSTSINWGAGSSSNIWATSSTQSQQPPTSAFGSMSLGQQQQQEQQHHQQQQKSSFGIPPPPPSNNTTSSGLSGFSLAPPPSVNSQPKPPLQQQHSSSAFGGLGGLSNSNSGSLNSLASLAAANNNRPAGSGMGMGMGSMGGMMNNSMGGGMNNGNGMSMNSMMGMGSMGMIGQQQQNQQNQQGQQNGGGLDKYASLL